jgi:formate dehydrogenase gamma subunit
MVEYRESIHGRALQAGVTDSPTCIDCHGDHLILGSDDPDAPICGARQAQDTCGKCHDDPMIISKYGLQDGVVGSYLESYHGWASRTGCEVTASCVDCHTSHRILPAEDPTSSISETNVVETCAQCHEGATPAFAASYDHLTASLMDNPVNRVIRGIYLWAIALIVGSMLLHNLVILNYFMIKRRREHETGQGSVVRFTSSEVTQHLLLTLSFMVLMVTGFALRFPESWWVEGLARLGMTESLRGDLHRVAGVVLILTSLYHAVYILTTHRGRSELKALRPSRQDWRDFVQNLRFHTFRSEEKAEFGRYDYSQKAEYWALVWGTALMALTGLILWFPTVVARILPGIVIPAAQTIHFYEAILAGLVVLVWHFFFVVFHPDEYPMSWTWLTGKMTKASAKVHHAKWYREVAKGDAHSNEAEGDPSSEH